MRPPLQIIRLAILDSIFIYFVNLAAGSSWESIRSTLCRTLINEKDQQVYRILAQSYSDRDVVFVQEAAAALVQRAGRHVELSSKFALLVPSKLNSKRDQNSMIFVDRGRFREASSIDVTTLVAAALDFVDAGDLFVVSILGLGGARWLLASFHGDSNGLSTQPVMAALRKAHRTTFKDHVLLAGARARPVPPRRGPVPRAAQGEPDGVGVGRPAGPAAQDDVQRAHLPAAAAQQGGAYHRRFSGATVSLKDWILACESQVYCMYPIYLV